MSETTPTTWVISITLDDDADGDAADRWMDFIMDAVYRHEPHFSGTVSMTKEPTGD